MTWMRAVCGKLETRYRYSNTLVYNTFPFPSLTDAQKQEAVDSMVQMTEIAEKEAAAEIARQLRLRNISGMILVDFMAIVTLQWKVQMERQSHMPTRCGVM